MTHRLKTWPKYFSDIRNGSKPFEVRLNDRNFQVDDDLELYEWNPKTGRATGNVLARTVTYVLHGGQFGIENGYCVLGIK